MKDLREMRELAGITQFSLSRRSGVSRTRLSLAECGEVELNETEKRKITTFLLAAIQLQHARAESVLADALPEARQTKKATP